MSVGDFTFQNEAAVAIGAVDMIEMLVHLQPHARMAQRAFIAVAHHAPAVDDAGFGRRRSDSHARAIAASAGSAKLFGPGYSGATSAFFIGVNRPSPQLAPRRGPPPCSITVMMSTLHSRLAVGE